MAADAVSKGVYGYYKRIQTEYELSLIHILYQSSFGAGQGFGNFHDAADKIECGGRPFPAARRIFFEMSAQMCIRDRRMREKRMPCANGIWSVGGRNWNEDFEMSACLLYTSRCV